MAERRPIVLISGALQELPTGDTLPGAGGGGGGAIQAVQSVKTDTASVAFGSWADTGLTVTITLGAAANKVLLLGNLVVGQSSAGSILLVRFVRGSTTLAEAGAAGSRRQGHGVRYQESTSSMGSVAMTYSDAPGSTGPHTYKLQFFSANGTAYVNRSGLDTNNDQYGRAVSTLIAVELPQ